MSNPATPDTILTQAIERYLKRTGNRCLEPRAALIDMDGTLYDSMPSHARAWQRMVTELGIECTFEEFFLYEGMTGASTIDLLIKRAWNRPATDNEKTSLYHLKTQYFNELPKVEPMPGAGAMLTELNNAGIKCVLVTGSAQTSVLDRIAADYPGAFAPGMRITAHDVANGKPHPEPYLRGMQLAGTAPAQSIVIENAPMGVKSGHDAGAFTVAVTTGPVPAENMAQAGADLIAPSMPQFATMLPRLLELASTITND
ncbi:MAG: HAD-IA family hydrolase [Muribaculaceae bacterium]|nr:HAD-IA family hydrolase [Muribaculaceae bacterium]